FLQCGTPWDGLGHIFRHGKMYGGRDASLVSSTAAARNGIEHYKDKIVTRGVLLNIARHKGVDALRPGEPIYIEDLESCAASQRVTVEPGDIVLVRTGDVGRRLRERSWGTFSAGDAPGLSFLTAPWLYDKSIAGLATDTWGAEVRPNELPGSFQPLHLVMVVNMGLLVGEIFHLEALSNDCAADGVYEFMFAAPPLPITPGWNRLKPGLRYALLCGDGPPVLFEQGDIGFQIQRHAPWIPAENIRWSYAWIKGAAGPASKQQVKKFTDAIVKEMRRYDVADKTLGVDFIDINMLNQFNEANLKWADGMTPMMEARAIKNVDEQECLRVVGAIGDAAHWETMRFLKPGLTENQVTAHIMEFLYAIPGMEDVEDVIVSSGPNTWPNWRNFSDRIIKPGEIVF